MGRQPPREANFPMPKSAIPQFLNLTIPSIYIVKKKALSTTQIPQYQKRHQIPCLHVHTRRPSHTSRSHHLPLRNLSIATALLPCNPLLAIFGHFLPHLSIDASVQSMYNLSYTEICRNDSFWCTFLLLPIASVKGYLKATPKANYGRIRCFLKLLTCFKHWS